MHFINHGGLKTIKIEVELPNGCIVTHTLGTADPVKFCRSCKNLYWEDNESIGNHLCWEKPRDPDRDEAVYFEDGCEECMVTNEDDCGCE